MTQQWHPSPALIAAFRRLIEDIGDARAAKTMHKVNTHLISCPKCREIIGSDPITVTGEE
jgi:DNA-binding helix-hairpin-helix protein with protein kinase domain